MRRHSGYSTRVFETVNVTSGHPREGNWNHKGGGAQDSFQGGCHLTSKHRRVSESPEWEHRRGRQPVTLSLALLVLSIFATSLLTTRQGSLGPFVAFPSSGYLAGKAHRSKRKGKDWEIITQLI